jgi:hypothetical protein
LKEITLEELKPPKPKEWHEDPTPAELDLFRTLVVASMGDGYDPSSAISRANGAIAEVRKLIGRR